MATETVGFEIVVNGTDEQARKLSKVETALSRITKERNDLIKRQKAGEILNDKEAGQLDKLTREQQKLRKQKTDTTRAVQNQNKAIRAIAGSYDALTAENAQLRSAMNKLPLNDTSGQLKKLQGRFKENTDKLKEFDKNIGQNFRNVGNYEGAIRSSIKSFGALAVGIGAGIAVIKKLSQAIVGLSKDFSGFEKEQKKVAAISGASASDLLTLEGHALSLGRATERTAQDASRLQLELAKLGFKPKQIQDATKDILDLSIAFDHDLGQSAILVGNAIRAFGLEANDASRVADVFARVSASTALDLNKLQTSLGTIAPVANSFGFSIEDTSALLGLLSDAGFDASSAATATRNILLNLVNTNGDLAKSLGAPVTNLDQLVDGLNTLSARNINLSEALELTSVKSVSAFSVFLSGADRAKALSKELQNARGTASGFAEAIGDSLAGETARAESALQGLRIELGRKLSGVIRSVLVSFQGFANTITDFISIPISENLQKQRIELNVLVAQINDANTSEERRVELIDKLNRNFPDFLGNLDKATVSNEQLASRLGEVNEQLTNQIIIQKQGEKVAEAANDLAEIRERRLEAEQNRIEALITLNENLGLGLNNATASSEEFAEQVLTQARSQQRLSAVTSSFTKEFLSTQDLIVRATSNQSLLSSTTGELAEAEENLSEVEKRRQAILASLNGTIVDGVDGSAEAGKATTELAVETEAVNKEVLKLIQAIRDLRVISGKEAQEAFDALIAKTKEFKTVIEETVSAGDINKLFDDESISEFEQRSEDLLVTSFKETLDGRQALLEANFEAGLITKRNFEEEMFKLDQERFARENALNDQRVDALKSSANELGQAFGEFIANQERNSDEFGKTIIKTALKVLFAQARIAITSAIAQSFAQPDSVASFGASGVARGAVLAALIEGALQGVEGVVLSQFAQGGVVPKGGGFIKGPSHKNGGVKFAVGGRVHEAEGDEIILNKNVSKVPHFVRLASSINQATGGRAFQAGGIVPSIQSPSIQNLQNSINLSAGDIARDIVNGIKQIPVVVAETEITSTQTRVLVNESLAEF